jgi:hypothetical protein
MWKLSLCTVAFAITLVTCDILVIMSDDITTSHLLWMIAKLSAHHLVFSFLGFYCLLYLVKDHVWMLDSKTVERSPAYPLLHVGIELPLIFLTMFLVSTVCMLFTS